MTFGNVVLIVFCTSCVVATSAYAGSSFPEGRPDKFESPETSKNASIVPESTPKGYYQYSPARTYDIRLLKILDDQTLSDEVQLRAKEFSSGCSNIDLIVSESPSSSCITRTLRYTDAKEVLDSRGKGG